MHGLRIHREMLARGCIRASSRLTAAQGGRPKRALASKHAWVRMRARMTANARPFSRLQGSIFLGDTTRRWVHRSQCILCTHAGAGR